MLAQSEMICDTIKSIPLGWDFVSPVLPMRETDNSIFVRPL